MDRRKTAFSPAPRARLAGALGALLVGGGVVVAVAGAFFQAASDPWLLPTPPVLEIAAACRAKPQRQEREACIRTLVASRGGVRPGDRLARGQPPETP